MQDPKKRITVPDLKKIGKFLSQLDKHIVSVIAKRMDLSVYVEKRKRIEEANQPILRRVVEKQRLEQVADWANDYGVDPQFAKSIQYLLMAESCRVQMECRETGLNEEEEKYANGPKEEWYAFLRRNLQTLTDEVAPVYDEMYEKAPFATRSYIVYETNIIGREIETLKAINNTERAVDLGCATGKISLQLLPHFQEVIGFDLSPAMIQVAQNNIRESGQKNTSFRLVDIETRLPLESNSVSLAVMNLGTASEIQNIRLLLASLKNILKKDGRFILSFYNQNALYFRCFVPWQLPLIASIDQVRHCLNVKQGERDYLIYARPYSEREVRQMIERSGLKVSEITSCPTIASILPDEFFAGQVPEDAISGIDSQLYNHGTGVYILVVGRKIT